MAFPSTIGFYRVEREIGRGGMGVVFLARDTRLDRLVAIKALPEDLAADPERLQRFEREARVLASLNHPNIGAIYGLEESGGARYLILEHVEGETLAERLARGPLRLAEALDVCQQIAAGIEAAHEGGVIHRDLKPGNVMITPGDAVKVLDFGLAKGRIADVEPGKSPTALDSPTLAPPPTPANSPTLAHSPTLQSPATMPGVILGTAGYLSPEQARGKPVDRRTDIWSFGCVLFECLTGRLAFEGETVSDTIAKILEREVDWARLPHSTPPRVRELLQRCLEKDSRRRLRDIGEARLALEEIRAVAAAPGAKPVAAEQATRRSRTRRGMAVGAAVAVAYFAGMTYSHFFGGGGPAENPITRLSIAFPSTVRVFDAVLTPDGRTVVAIGRPRAAAKGEEPRTQIYVRPLDRSTFEPVRGTERADGFTLSRDGKWIGFTGPVSERTVDRQLSKVPVDGSAPPVPIAKFEDDWAGRTTWLHSGDLLVGKANGREYVRIPASGGSPSAARRFEVAGFEGSFDFRGALPGDRGVLLHATWYERGAYRMGIGVLDLKSGKSKLLVRDGSSPQYSPTGHLLFTRHDVLLAVPLNLDRLETAGEPAAIFGGLRVGSSWANASVQLTSGGTLLHLMGGNVAQDRHAVIVDPDGRVSEWSDDRQPFESSWGVSRDGSRFAAVIANADAIYEIWVSERGQSTSRRVVAVAGADCGAPLWSPDGTRLAYSHESRTDADGIYITNADGSGAPRRVVKSSQDRQAIPTSWSPDGGVLLCTLVDAGRPQLVRVSLSRPEEEPTPLFGGNARRGLATLSPDGRSIAYVSDETGRFETFVCGWDGVAPVGQPLLVSSGGGGRPFWNAAGRRLYYLGPQSRVMSVSIERSPRITATAPALVWDRDALRVAEDLCDILPDGRLLAIRKGQDEDEITRYDVALNFLEELKGKLRAAGK
jgi:hypothetical protein